MSYLFETDEGFIMNLLVLPNASKDEISEIVENRLLKIRITSPAVDNKANNHLIDFIARTFKLKRSQIEFLHGKKSKIKQVLIKKMDIQELESKLKTILT